MAYDISDIKQAALGSVVAVLFFYLLRAGNPISIDPTKGLIIGMVWLYITGMPFIKQRLETKIHFVGNIMTAFVVSSVLALAFDMVTMEQLLSFEIFGTAAWLGVLLAIPTAQFFDRKNILNIYERWYFKRRK